jgi:hypothetical protein
LEGRRSTRFLGQKPKSTLLLAVIVRKGGAPDPPPKATKRCRGIGGLASARENAFINPENDSSGILARNSVRWIARRVETQCGKLIRV